MLRLLSGAVSRALFAATVVAADSLREIDLDGRLVAWKCDEVSAERADVLGRLVRLQDDLERQARYRGLAPGRADLR